METLQHDYETERAIDARMRREHNLLEEVLAQSEFDPETGTMHVPKYYRPQLAVLQRLIQVRSSCQRIGVKS